jgi:Xaa-Pro aminopeptidase
LVDSKFVPIPSMKERDRRWKRIRESMVIHGLDCLVVWGSDAMMGAWGEANFRYISGLNTNGGTGFVIFPLEAEPTAIVWHPDMTVWWRKAHGWMDDIRGRKLASFIPPITDRIHELHLEGGVLGLVGGGEMRQYDHERLLKELPSAQFVKADGILSEVRMIKSPEEIKFMEKASQIVDRMWEAGVKSAKPGVKECVVYGDILRESVATGGEHPIMLLWEAGPEPFRHAGAFATERPLAKGDMINVELHGRYGGYLAHGERPISLGKPKKEFRHIFDVMEESFQSGVKRMGPGRTFKEVADAFYAPITKSGLAVCELGIHGHGLESGEWPNMELGTPFHDPGGIVSYLPKPFEFKENMVLGIVVDLYDQGWKGGEPGLMLGDTVQITSSGSKVLCKTPLDILLA